MIDEKQLQQVSAIFSALGSPTRLKIIELISETQRPLHIKAVAQVIEKDYAAVYRHIGVLEECGLVGVYDVGRSRVIYLKNAELIKQCVAAVKKMM
ncbi:MAG: winged helix-turn-helix transcriptional regulator [Candidatus Bathyarchaeota archaeon]|nr:winged helix-turn-helix domain-containing protein [Candidatus Bathyarchaeum tardum]WGM89476.1 MAG: winged helix-turn-helix domain-containing protein [Candidatus Bathyarchaeum tardum]WNZ28250.1 MAG: winged helix-turn-helix transcriptional regulator [Candidatus Bathyarchaeota archaeon]